MILCVETSTRAFSLSLIKGDEYAHLEFFYGTAHSQNIAHSVDFLLKSVKSSIADILEVYTDIGPGSFTGIRIGLSFVNTLSQCLSIPTLGVSSLDLLAFEKRRWYASVVPFIKSKTSEVYTAYYKEGKRATSYLVLKRQDFSDFIAEHKPRYIVGMKDEFNELELDESSESEHCFSFPRARTLHSFVRMCGLNPRKGYLKPLYLRGF